jgi:hypothetical protein
MTANPRQLGEAMRKEPPEMMTIGASLTGHRDAFRRAETLADQHSALEALMLLIAFTAKIGNHTIDNMSKDGKSRGYVPSIGRAGLFHAFKRSIGYAGRELAPGITVEGWRLESLTIPRSLEGATRGRTRVEYVLGQNGDVDGVNTFDLRLPSTPMYRPDDPKDVAPVFSHVEKYVGDVLRASLVILPDVAYQPHTPSFVVSAPPYGPSELTPYKPTRM